MTALKKKISRLRSHLQKIICCQIPLRYLNSVYFPHPVGIVIASEVIINSNVTIYQNVTIGRRVKSEDKVTDYPTINDNVIIYAGAVVVGGITICKNVIIGANAVVTRDIPENSLVTGHNIIRHQTL